MTTLYISLEKNKFSHSRSFPSIADQNDFFYQGNIKMQLMYFVFCKLGPQIHPGL